jgi:hypothetical protein
MPLPESIRRLSALSARDWQLLIEATVLAVGIEGALRILPLRRVVGWCQGSRTVARPRIGATLDALTTAARLPYRVLPWPSTCLRRSLVLTALLRRRGLPATVRFGVRRQAELLLAHAWVECDGALVDATSGEGYEALEPVLVSSAGINRIARWSP